MTDQPFPHLRRTAATQLSGDSGPCPATARRSAEIRRCAALAYEHELMANFTRSRDRSVEYRAAAAAYRAKVAALREGSSATLP